MRDNARSIWRVLLPATLAFVGVYLLVGCIYLPTFNAVVDGPDASAKVGEASSDKTLRVGISTRDDVRRVLGKPFHETADGRLWVYSWKRQKGLLVYPLCFQAFPENKAYATTIEFDERDVIVRHETEVNEGRAYLLSPAAADRFTPARVMYWNVWLRLQANPQLYDRLSPQNREQVIRQIKAATQPAASRPTHGDR
jgi:hypothetical protein